MDPDPVLREHREPDEFDRKDPMTYSETGRTMDYSEALEQLDVHTAQSVVGRAILDSAYREQLMDDPDRALEGYEITPEEREALHAIDLGEFDRIAEDFFHRFSKSEDDPEHSQLEGEVLLMALQDVLTNVLKLDGVDLEIGHSQSEGEALLMALQDALANVLKLDDVDMDIDGATDKDSWKGE